MPIMKTLLVIVCSCSQAAFWDSTAVGPVLRQETPRRQSAVVSRKSDEALAFPAQPRTIDAVEESRHDLTATFPAKLSDG